MSSVNAVVVLELNELSPPLIDRFIDEGVLPNFARLRAESVVFTTVAEEPQGHLNPWIQWVTAHTGLPFDDHGVFKLGEGRDLRSPTIADVVSHAGRDVWLCGPMNVVPTSPVRGMWLPDPWHPDPHPQPSELEPFLRFVRTNVQEHTNVARRLSRRDVAAFMAFMARHGLRVSTVAAAVRQVVGERLGRRSRWQRAALLDRFQWDVFAWYHRRRRPAFATYFSNTTAHYQHLYWRYMDPAPFTLKPTEDELERFGDAVRFGYGEMDRLIGRAYELIRDGDALVLCTALSQQPYVAADERGGKRFHRPYDIGGLMARLGVSDSIRIAPVMSEQFHLFFADEEDARRAADLLDAATVEGRRAFDVRRVGTDVFTGCAIVDDVDAGAVIDVPINGRRVPFHEHLYRSETAKSGYHHPEGAFWVRAPGCSPRVVDDRVPLRAVAPTLLSLLGLEQPASMRAEPLLTS